jgi:proteasome accessory factor C
MPEFSAPLKEVARMLDLVPYLSTHSYISLSDLAQEFNVSEKEIARELTTLSMCGLPGYTPYELIEIFFENGYVTINNHDPLDLPRALSFSEIATLLLGLELLRDSLVAELPEMTSEIAQLISLLTNLSGGTIGAESDATISTLAEVERAITNRSAVTITYHSTSKDEISTREVEPLEIIFENGVSYLNAFCRSAQTFRRFRVDRIKKVAEVNIASTLANGAQPSEQMTVVNLRVHGNRRANSEELGLKDLDPSGKVTLPVFSVDWLIRNVVAAAPEITALEDVQLRSEIRLTAAKVLALYS